MGVDSGQEFSIHPRTAFRRENFRFSQNYLSSGLTMEYKGSFRGAVLIGTWCCPFDESMNGSFALWPVNYESYYTITPALRDEKAERNENETGISYVEINNDDAYDVTILNNQFCEKSSGVQIDSDSDCDSFSDCVSDIYEDVEEDIVQKINVICSDSILSIPAESLAGIQYFNWSSKNWNVEVELPLFDSQTVTAAIDIKEGRIPEVIPDYMQLFHLGVYLLEPVIIEKNIELYCQNESDSNFALYILGLKEIFELPEFCTDKLYGFIDFHFVAAIESRLWIQLSETLLRRIIRRTTLFILDDRAIISGIKKWLDHNIDEDDDNFLRLLTSMATYVTETPPKDWKTDELWSWLMDELGLETVKNWSQLFSGEYGFRSCPKFSEKIFFCASSKSINKIYQLNPNNQDFISVTEIPNMNFPGDSGHMVPLQTECGTLLIFFGGDLKKVVWGYSVTYSAWFSLPALPRRVWNAGVQVVHHQSAGDFIYIIGGYGKYLADEEGPAKGMDILRFSTTKINWKNHITDFYSCRQIKHSDGWEHYSCPIVRTEHHTGANLCLVDLFSRKSVERRQRTIRTHISSDALYLLVIGGKYPHRNPAKISTLLPDELITMIPLGNHKKDDLTSIANNDEIVISRQTFSNLQESVNLFRSSKESSLFSILSATNLGLSLEQLVLTGNLPLSRHDGKIICASKFFPQPLSTSQESFEASRTSVNLLAEYALLTQVTLPLAPAIFPCLSESRTPTLNFLGTPRWGGDVHHLSYDVFNSKLDELREIPDFELSKNLCGLQQTHFSLLKSLFFNYVHL
ncbi:unnamed protein product [Oikopleura dioica]|uniref:BACK domain-containing protein n=1 Tax=Oikopleura dioica TaxID=34765 RepID=E4XB75_OIKDI|nr:unnamed protein product [Oikopleura dioica]